MPSYCTVDEIRAFMVEDELIQVTDDAGIGEVNVAIVMLALTSAATEIDGYLSARYALPLPDSQVGLLNTLNRDMAIHHLYLRKIGSPDHVKDQYERAVKLLSKIAEGKMGLGPEDPEPPAEADIPEFESSPAVFGRDNMKGW